MAVECTDLDDLFKNLPPITAEGEKKNLYWHYGEEEDAFVFYFRKDPDYARRLNSRVTAYLSVDTDELVGCQIKSVRSVLEDIGSFDVTITHGQVKLKLLFWAFMSSVSDSPDGRRIVLDLIKAADEQEIEIPNLIKC